MRYIIDSLITESAGNLYYFNDTYPWSQNYNTYYEPQDRQNSILTCLEREYYDAICPVPSPSLSVAKLSSNAIKHAPNVYLVPQNSLLKLIAHEPEDGPDACASPIPDLLRLPVIPEQSYILVDKNTIISFIKYEEGCAEGRGLYEQIQQMKSLAEPINSVIFLSHNGFEKKSLADCFQASLKDTVHCRCSSQFPPHLEVWINDELYDEVCPLHRGLHVHISNNFGEKNKDIILEYLKEGSLLYNYFSKELYKDVDPYNYQHSVTFHRLSEIGE